MDFQVWVDFEVSPWLWFYLTISLNYFVALYMFILNLYSTILIGKEMNKTEQDKELAIL